MNIPEPPIDPPHEPDYERQEELERLRADEAEGDAKERNMETA